MIDRREFEAIREQLASEEEQREELIQLSRDIIKLSKLVIYSINRNELMEAQSLREAMEAQKVRLLKICEQPVDFDANICLTALQEYVEAVCYADVVLHQRLPTKKSLSVDTMSYLLGLSDLTGELVRRVVNLIIEKKIAEAKVLVQLVHDLYGEFLRFDLRNGELRRKFDAMKYNVKKLEDLMYDVHLRAHD